MPWMTAPWDATPTGGGGAVGSRAAGEGGRRVRRVEDGRGDLTRSQGTHGLAGAVKCVAGAAPVPHGDGDLPVQQLPLRGQLVQERDMRQRGLLQRRVGC